MNVHLANLQAYPFEKLRKLLKDCHPPGKYSAINMGIGEPQHPTQAFIYQALKDNLSELSKYPSTQGEPAFRQACADWLLNRYQVVLDIETQILPVNGTREALFSFAQAVISPSAGSLVLCPNPFYQIYEGAAYLAGAKPQFINVKEDFSLDWSAVSSQTWSNTKLVFVCSPHNPTGYVMTISEWEHLFNLSDQYGFMIASDECYGEIYFHTPPLGGLEAAKKLGRHDFAHLVSFFSLSKRSNVPGLRSGFVAGDKKIIQDFLLYRTYHGGAMGGMVQRASAVAWRDEDHVELNRSQYREKFTQLVPRLQAVLDVDYPQAGFYLWIKVEDDCDFAKKLYANYHLTVLPGSYLARENQGINPGQGWVRLALVADFDQCSEGIDRIVQFVQRGA
ncbi:MAG: succinyldiaminopimelate transaminase [Gammaproteobacteria bacterium]|nr:succinyldiaminopimelate transaminase [Gammaproteobacteria bacterium]